MLNRPPSHHRRSIRLEGFDYSQAGVYFVTIVTHGRECVFGEIMGEEMRLSPVGEMAAVEWERLAGRFSGILIDGWVVMPNHVHAIIVIIGEGAAPGFVSNGAGDSPLRPYEVAGPHVAPGSLGAIVRAYKSVVAARLNHSRFSNGGILWQRNYYEHIIRSQVEWERVRESIQTNPIQWELDHENPTVGR